MTGHQTRFRVRYAETDQMGVVYYANYLVWMEVGRVELVRALGLPYKDLEQSEGLYLSVIDAQCRYVFPARYDQEIVIETKILKATSRTVEFGYLIGSAEPGRLLAEGSTRHIWLNRDWKPTSLPSRYRNALGVASWGRERCQLNRDVQVDSAWRPASHTLFASNNTRKTGTVSGVPPKERVGFRRFAACIRAGAAVLTLR